MLELIGREPLCRLSQQLCQLLPPQAGSVLTMFVLLHLRAAVIDELESPQAAHLLIHTQVLRHAKRSTRWPLRTVRALRCKTAVKEAFVKASSKQS